MKKTIIKIIYTIPFITPIFGLSQKIQILDVETKKAINNVTIYDNDGKIINTSNNEGIIELNNLSNIELYHPEYESKLIKVLNIYIYTHIFIHIN